MASSQAASSQARGSAMLPRVAPLLLFAMLLMMDSVADARLENVGGRAGWTEYQNYGHMYLRRGDVVAFNYNPRVHSVVEVNYQEYSNCFVPYRPTRQYHSGRDYIQLNNPGTYFFICGTPGHCSRGMKVSITVY